MLGVGWVFHNPTRKRGTRTIPLAYAAGFDSRLTVSPIISQRVIASAKGELGCGFQAATETVACPLEDRLS